MSHHKKESHNIMPHNNIPHNNASHNTSPHNNRPYKILAQSFGMLVCGFFLLYLAGEGFSEIVKRMGKPFISIILLPVAGYIVTWINEKVGAAIMIIGGVILFGYLINWQDVKMAFLFGVPFIVAGSLFIVHICKRTALQHKKP